MPAWTALPSVADGVLSRRQGRQLDLTEDAWQWKLDQRLWTPLTPGVAALHNGPPTDSQVDWAAVLKLGDGALLAGDSVLREHGFPFKELGYVDVATTKRVRTKHRVLDRPLRAHTVRGLDRFDDPGASKPSMTVAAAVVFAAEWAASPRAAEWRLATSVQRGLVVVRDLRQLLLQDLDLARGELLATALDDVELGAHAMSELDFLKLCRQHGLPEPDELQVKVRAGGVLRFLDLRYRQARVRGEIDGGHHRFVETWEADLLRSNDLHLKARGSDEIELRWTGSQVRHQGWLVARQLRAALRL